MAQGQQTESQRLKRFRMEIAATIPRFPNDRATLVLLQQKHLTDLLIDYINWRSRYVGVRPRSVTVEDAAARDPRWNTQQVAIDAFLDKVRRGADLTAYLSVQPRTRGFTPAALASSASAQDRWSDKDLVLNAMGFHHFHLDAAAADRSGHGQGTGNLIFAQVARDRFTVVAFFDHSVFDFGSPERIRLFGVHDNIALRGTLPGQVVVTSMIATSGHRIDVVHYAIHCSARLRQIDPLLDQPENVALMFEGTGCQPPPKPRFQWCWHHLDLGFTEKMRNIHFSVQRGWN